MSYTLQAVSEKDLIKSGLNIYTRELVKYTDLKIRNFANFYGDFNRVQQQFLFKKKLSSNSCMQFESKIKAMHRMKQIKG